MASRPDFADYLEQLARLPGGPAAAVRDFLGPWLSGPEVPSEQGLPCWPLREGGRLCLRPAHDAPALLLVHETDGAAAEIARFGRDLIDAAGGPEAAASPLVLALLAIAAGDVDDARRLKRRLPGLDGAARDLMLMTLCRLCG
jgi:hypothetical protein